jgi:hypothetical protein
MQAMRDHSDVLGFGLRTEGKELWTTSNDGQVYVTSTGGKVRGFRAHFILPFQNLSGDLGQEYFVDGVDDEAMAGGLRCQASRSDTERPYLLWTDGYAGSPRLR